MASFEPDIKPCALLLLIYSFRGHASPLTAAWVRSRIGCSSIYCLSLLPRHMFKDCLIALHHTVGCYLAISLRNAFQKKTINTWVVDKTSIALGLNKCASLTLIWNITILFTSEYLSGYIKACSVVFLKKRKDSKSPWPGMAAPRDYNDRGCTLKWCLDVKTI